MTETVDALDAIAIGLAALGVEKAIHRHHERARAGLIEKAINECGFVIVPKDDIRPYPSLLSEELLLGLVAHLTAGTADLSIVRLQISRMRDAAAQEPKPTS